MRPATSTWAVVVLLAAVAAACSTPDAKDNSTQETTAMADVPQLYRAILQVADLGKAEQFYSNLLDTKGRKVRGGRHYFDCGPVILALLDVTLGGQKATPNPDHIYFSVKDLESVRDRAVTLECLSKEDVDGEPAGDIVKRPWGERSFYAVDPWGNRLCFVDSKTIFTGK
jgi:predicted enzyme related to lactoylglutathione lyase